MTQEEREVKAKALGAKYAVVIDDKTIFLKEPSKEVYKAFFALYDQDPASAKETVVRTLAINEISDMDVLNDYKSLLTVCAELSEIMALKKSTLKIL